MMKHPLRKTLFALAPAVVVVPGLMITGAMADSAQQAGNQQAHSAAYSVVKHRRHLAREEFVSRLGGAAPVYNAVAVGKGIPDRVCDLPSSGCPNEMRIAQ
jgi:hypothetical protein